MNSVNISGRLTRDPQLRQTQNGKSVANFSIAVQRPGIRDTTDFIDCVAWDKTAEFVNNFFHKGKYIEISGVLTMRDFETNAGEKRKITEVRCDVVGFGGAKKEDDEPRRETAETGDEEPRRETAATDDEATRQEPTETCDSEAQWTERIKKFLLSIPA